MIFFRDKAPAKEVSNIDIPLSIQCGIIEIKVCKKKWIMLGIYRPSSQNERELFGELGKVLDICTMRSDNLIIIGDFNVEEDDDSISNFMNLYGLGNLIKVPTSFKSINARCIDLILTNNVKSFKGTRNVEIGLSDFHSMIVTVVKSSFIKRGPRIITYRDYSKFDPLRFKEDLREQLGKKSSCRENFEDFNATVLSMLDKHAPIKKKSVQANDGPFMTKTIRKAIMNRTRLRNIYCNNRTVDNLKAFKKQRTTSVRYCDRLKRITIMIFTSRTCPIMRSFGNR